MKNLCEQINAVNDIDGFLKFVAALSRDAAENPKEWENTTIQDYLEQIVNWAEDYSVLDTEINWEKADYKTFAKMLYMGKIYE